MLENLRNGIFDYTVIGIIDILLVLILMLFIYRFLRGSVAFYMLFGLFVVFVFSEVFMFFNFRFLSAFFRHFSKYGLLIVALIFQPEIRKMLLYIGRNDLTKRFKFLKRMFWASPYASKERRQVDAILEALDYLSKNKTGAIIVLQQSANLDLYADTGVKLNADISGKLIESIFAKTSPLHDGAIIIEDYTIHAASCTLPISDNDALPSRIGMRHKSAVGITEVSDACVFIVSEETGEISFAQYGSLKKGIELERAKEKLERIYTTTQ